MGLVAMRRGASGCGRALIQKGPLDFLVKRPLIFFHRQNVIGLGVEDRPRDLRLTAHRVDRHQRARQCQYFEEFRDRGDLIALFIDDGLPEGDVIGGRPRADHVNGRLARSGVETSVQRFAVDGDDLARRDFVQGGNPTQETRLELGGLDRGQHGVEAIVRGDAAPEVEKLRQPLTLLAAEVRNGDEIIRSADHGADGDGDNVDQGVENFSSSRVGQFDKMVPNAGGECLGHGEYPWQPRFARLRQHDRINEPCRPIHVRLPILAQSP